MVVITILLMLISELKVLMLMSQLSSPEFFVLLTIINFTIWTNFSLRSSVVTIYIIIDVTFGVFRYSVDGFGRAMALWNHIGIKTIRV